MFKNLFKPKKYTDEIELIRDSLQFYVSPMVLASVLSIERISLDTSAEETLMVTTNPDVVDNKKDPNWTFSVENYFKISREQHNDLIDKLNDIKLCKCQ